MNLDNASSDEDNINDYGGHSIKSLYVRQKYASFKEEILTHIDLKKYSEQVQLKAQTYAKTTIARQTCATDEDNDLHYGIKEGTPLSMQNLMALILYCNCTKLSRTFSATFRCIVPAEPLFSVKSRNREYWWWSKILRETVEYFGSNRYGRNYGGEHYASKGPYYCGMSELLSVSEFNIRLNAPVSGGGSQFWWRPRSYHLAQQ